MSIDEESEVKVKRVSRASPIYVVRDDAGKVVSLTADGLALVENLATYAKPQRYIASKLGVTSWKFDSMLGKASDDPATEVRMAWERGHGAFEASYRKMLLAHVKKNAIAAIFFGKSVFGMKDQPSLIDNRVEDHRIQIVIPASQTREQLFEQLGIDGPMDYRRDRSKPNKILDVTPPSPLGIMAPPSPEPVDQPSSQSPIYPAGKYSRTQISHMKSQGAWNPAIHIED